MNKKAEAPKPGRARCRWCNQARRTHRDVYFCPHCDEPHNAIGCDTCKAGRDLMDNRNLDGETK